MQPSPPPDRRLKLQANADPMLNFVRRLMYLLKDLPAALEDCDSRGVSRSSIGASVPEQLGLGSELLVAMINASLFVGVGPVFTSLDTSLDGDESDGLAANPKLHLSFRLPMVTPR